MKPELTYDKNGNPNIHTCPNCGYWWYQGSDGTHSCSRYLLLKIKSLEEQNAELQYDIKRNKGLKDHEICGLVNAVCDWIQLRLNIPHQSLRGIISRAVVRYLEEKKLRVDMKPELRG